MDQYSGFKSFVMAGGGVAANTYIRQKMEALCTQHNLAFIVPPQNLCTDNGAMIITYCDCKWVLLYVER